MGVVRVCLHVYSFTNMQEKFSWVKNPGKVGARAQKRKSRIQRKQNGGNLFILANCLMFLVEQH